MDVSLWEVDEGHMHAAEGQVMSGSRGRFQPQGLE
jgi:hypothetical protein